VQTRQVYVFSSAAFEGGPEWAVARARDGVEFLLAHFRDEARGGFFLTTDLAGVPLDRTKDTYAHAFVLFALAHYLKAAEDLSAGDLARDTFELLESHVVDAHGGFRSSASEEWLPLQEPGAGAEEVLQQNPTMHMFEALLALYSSTGEGLYWAAASRIYELLRERLVDAAGGFVRESFAPGWERLAGDAGDVLEPGHHFEWAWLLHEYARLGGDPRSIELADRLYDFARAHGVDSEHGGVYDRIAPDGRVLADSKRLWPQTEYVRALALRTARGDAQAREDLAPALDLLFSRYRDPASAGWRERAARDGAITSDVMNASSVYHVWGSLLEVEQLLAMMEEAEAAELGDEERG
jgi:mannose-6-phosphate isomerase